MNCFKLCLVKTLDCFHGAVIEKGTNQLIGLCGLNPYKVNELEIEFKIGVPYWNKGYATELGMQIIKDAFAADDIKGIYGMAQPENTAFRKVLEKIGMKYMEGLNGNRRNKSAKSCRHKQSKSTL